MFALDNFSGAPLSGYLIFEPITTVSGLQANALLNSVNGNPQQIIVISGGLLATAYLNSGSSTTTFPRLWTSVNTDQYSTS
jgi:hypothetical protein